MWSVGGAVMGFVLALVAFRRSRSEGGYYDADVYGMTSRTHRTYALLSLIFTGAFAASFFAPSQAPAVWIAAAFVPFGLFYVTSFLRGAHEDDDERH